MDFNLFFPIAGHNFNALTILVVGLVGGVVSNSLGIGSGIVVTPALLTLIGVPPFVAVTSQMGNAIGINCMGFLSYWRRRDIDFSLGAYLFVGGALGVSAEIWLLRCFHKDTVGEKMVFVYTIVLTALATLLLIQNIKAIFSPKTSYKGVIMRHWMIYFPWHRIFIRSRTEISILVPLAVGFGTGLITASLGGGNNLVMLPIISYLIGRISPVVQGTTLFASFMITFVATGIQCFAYTPFDLLLVLILMIGGTIGSKIGVFISYYVPRYYLGIVGSLVIYSISAKFIFDFKNHNLKEAAHSVDHVSNSLSSLPQLPKTLILLDFLHHSLIGYVCFGIISIILVAFLLEKALQHTMALFSK